MFKRQGLLIVVCVSLFIPHVLSQTATGTILGTVRDVSQAVAPKADIVVRNIDTGVERRIVTDSLGNYVVTLLQPGAYEVSAQLTGFKKAVRSGIVLHVDERDRIDFQLEIGNLSESPLNVVADAPLIQSDSAALGAVVDQHKVIELPLNGRDFFQLTYLVPGAVSGAQGSQNSTQGGAVAVNGMREQSNNFLLDGVDNNDHVINQVVVPPPIDAILEFKVQSGIYNAEFGTRAGAQVNFVTRSGGNEFHGSLYEFHRNAALDAKNFFDLPDQKIPKFIRNQYGFSAGGPVARDRTFFFGNFEGLRERKAITRLARVPSPEFIRGDFSALPASIRNPRTASAFPGNVIPQSEMDPIGRAIAQFYPAPNTDRAGGNLLTQPVRRNAIDQFVGRIDHQWSRHSFFGRYAFVNEDQFNPFDPFVDPTNIPGFGTFRLNRGQNLALGWIDALSPTLLNDLRIGFNRLHAAITHESHGNDIAARLGIRGLPTQARDVGFPGTRVVGYDALLEPTNAPQSRADNSYQIIESLSWQKGRHALKFGGDVQHRRDNTFIDILARGLFIHTGAVSGNPVADLLLGRPTVAVQAIGDTAANFKSWSTSFYVQDSFQASGRFHVEYGLRYEYHQPPVDRFDRLHIPDLTSRTPAYIQCGTKGVPRACMNDDKNNFSPRLGFAFTPFANRKTVVRGGYGVFYDAGIANYNSGSRLNPPNFGINVYLFQSLRDPFPAGSGESEILATFSSTKFSQAYGQQWSLNVQQNLRDHYLVEVAYVGSRGTKLLARNNPNQPRPGGPRPFPAYGPLEYGEPAASSVYHGLSVRAERRFQAGMSFLSSYTFSKSIDDSSALFGSAATGGLGGYPQNSLDRRGDRGLSDFDNRHNLVLNYIWELPFGRGRAIGGWQVAGILSFRSSRPFTPVLIGTSDSNTDNGAGGGLDRPHLVGNPHLSDPKPERWFNTDAFARPKGTFGSAGRNILRGPGLHTVDFAVMKSVVLRETSRIQFRAEFFNLFNHPNFNLPVGDFNSASFGRVTSAKDSRQIQMGVRLEF